LATICCNQPTSLTFFSQKNPIDDSKRKGKYTFPNGGTYEGEWLTGALHGTGVYTYFNIIYEGKWEKGKRHGDGKLTYSSGAVYDGNWKEDKQCSYFRPFLLLYFAYLELYWLTYH
jgi:hypothetical protein